VLSLLDVLHVDGELESWSFLVLLKLSWNVRKSAISASEYIGTL
jgi:hypothetical protein